MTHQVQKVFIRHLFVVPSMREAVHDSFSSLPILERERGHMITRGKKGRAPELIGFCGRMNMQPGRLKRRRRSATCLKLQLSALQHTRNRKSWFLQPKRNFHGVDAQRVSPQLWRYLGTSFLQGKSSASFVKRINRA